MDKDRVGTGPYMISVGVGDDKVVDALMVGGPVLGASDLDVSAGADAEPHAWIEVGVDPGVDVAGNPEGVGVGGYDHPRHETAAAAHIWRPSASAASDFPAKARALLAGVNP